MLPTSFRRWTHAIAWLFLTSFPFGALAGPPTVVVPRPDVTIEAGSSLSFYFVHVTPGTDPVSSGIEVSLDMRPFGGPLQGRFVNQGFLCDDDTGGDFTFFSCVGVPVNAPTGTRDLVLTVSDREGRSSTARVTLTVAAPADADGDGLPDRWESEFGFDPNVAGDALLDPDGDGLSNLDEFRAGSHPSGRYAAYFAEGASTRFFQTRFVHAWPGTKGNMVLRMVASDGAVSSGRVAGAPEHDAPGTSYASVLESDQPLIAERLMSWGDGIGSSAEVSMTALSTTWYLAEGATQGPLDLFYLLANFGDEPADVTVTYLRPSPLPPIVKHHMVGPHSRATIWVDYEDPALAATDVAAAIAADQPIAVERAMYLSTAAQPFIGGHAGAGVPAASTTWYLAEGFVSQFFNTYYLIGNAGTSDALVSVKYLDGVNSVEHTVVVPAQSRVTIDVARQLVRPPSFGFGAAITADQPVFVERAMWWPGSAWTEGHLSAAVPSAARRWAFAPVGVTRIGYGDEPSSSSGAYLLVANPSSVPTNVRVTLSQSGKSQSITIQVRAESRRTIDVNALAATLFEFVFGDAGVLVESEDADIVVERASYTDVNGEFWAAGHVLMGTRLPDQQ